MSAGSLRRWLGVGILTVGPSFLGAMVPGRRAHYAEGPPLGHTGGFGEPTCQQCHSDYPLNEGGGQLVLLGVPMVYAPGTRYRITIALERDGMARAGFQLAARYADGAEEGASAGMLGGIDERVEIATSSLSRVQYAEQTGAGSALVRSGSAAWIVEWTAPAPAAGSIRFDVAANAANDDESELGDYIYTTSATVGGPTR